MIYMIFFKINLHEILLIQTPPPAVPLQKYTFIA